MCRWHMAWHDRDSVTDIYFTTLAITNTGDEDTEVHVTTSRNVALPEQSAKPTCAPDGHSGERRDIPV